jgi:hypothetical protein
LKSTLDVQSTFLDMLRSASAELLSYSALEFLRAETTEAHPQAAPVEQFPENGDIFEEAADTGARRFQQTC